VVLSRRCKLRHRLPPEVSLHRAAFLIGGRGAWFSAGAPSLLRVLAQKKLPFTRGAWVGDGWTTWRAGMGPSPTLRKRRRMGHPR
jgi:hypothetical protein